MGFTRKITGMFTKKESAQTGPVLLDSVDSYILERISEEEERIVEESGIFVEHILEGIQELSQFLETLREKEREDMFKRLDRIVKNAQKRFADSLKNVVTRIQRKPQTYAELVVFHQEVADALQQMQKLNKMHGSSLYLAFDKEMKSFTKTMKKMTAYHHLLGKHLQSEGEELQELGEIHEKVLQRGKIEQEAASIVKEEANIENSVETLEKEIKQLEARAKALESSDKYQKLVNIEKQREKLKETLTSVEKEVYNILHPLDRDFRKFKRQVELGNISFDLNLLDEYEPLTEHFLKEEEGYPNLRRIAETMKEALKTQKIKEKGRKKEKVLDILGLILDDGLRTYQQQYCTAKEQLEAKSPDKDIETKIETVKRDVEEKKHKIAQLKTRKEGLSARKVDITERIKDIEEEIQERCGECGIDVVYR